MDSMVVFSWFSDPHESFKQYVLNRIHQIQSVLSNCNWWHVPTFNNPADCVSCRLMPSELPSFTLQWHSLRFIYDSPDEWGVIGFVYSVPNYLKFGPCVVPPIWMKCHQNGLVGSRLMIKCFVPWPECVGSLTVVVVNAHAFVCHLS